MKWIRMVCFLFGHKSIHMPLKTGYIKSDDGKHNHRVVKYRKVCRICGKESFEIKELKN